MLQAASNEENRGIPKASKRNCGRHAPNSNCGKVYFVVVKFSVGHYMILF